MVHVLDVRRRAVSIAWSHKHCAWVELLGLLEDHVFRKSLLNSLRKFLQFPCV